MGVFVGGGGVGSVFDLLNLVPDDLQASQGYASSDGGEILYLTAAAGTDGSFSPTGYYVVTFVASGGTRHASPYVKLLKNQTLAVAVPQLPLDTYDIEVALEPIDSSTIVDGIKILKRGYFKTAHDIRSGLLSSWKTGPETTSSEEDSLTTFDSNFALLTAAAGELVDEISGIPDGHTSADETQPRGLTTLKVRSVYPFVSSVPGKFSVAKGVIYSYTGLDTDTNEIQGIEILKGEDRGVTEGTAVWPLVA